MKYEAGNSNSDMMFWVFWIVVVLVCCTDKSPETKTNHLLDNSVQKCKDGMMYFIQEDRKVALVLDKDGVPVVCGK